jgi:hypothetical protein
VPTLANEVTDEDDAPPFSRAPIVTDAHTEHGNRDLSYRGGAAGLLVAGAVTGAKGTRGGASACSCNRCWG